MEATFSPEDGSWWTDEGMREDYLSTLVEDDVPDLSSPVEPGVQVRRAKDLSDEELLAELTYRMKRYSQEQEDQDDDRSSAPTKKAGQAGHRRTHFVSYAPQDDPVSIRDTPPTEEDLADTLKAAAKRRTKAKR